MLINVVKLFIPSCISSAITMYYYFYIYILLFVFQHFFQDMLLYHLHKVLCFFFSSITKFSKVYLFFYIVLSNTP